MATYTVSSLTELKSALSSASGGDTIALESGDYGTLNLSGKKYASNVTITSADSSNEATFTKVSLSNVANLTFDNVKIEGSVEDGHGVGTGFRVNSSTNITVQNSEFQDLAKGLQAWHDTNLKLVGNTFDNISYDGVVIGHSYGVTIDSNEIHMENGYGDIHRDGIQFYNEGSTDPSSDVTITNNVITSEDSVTHGIYIGNADGKNGESGEAYTDFVISGNTIATGQMLGIALSTADGVKITDNVVVQNDAVDSSKTVNIPTIRVDDDASNVTVSGNTVHSTPVIADEANNWTTISTLSGTDSTVVSLDYSATTSSSSTSSSSTTTSTSTTTTTSSDDGDVFRFLGSKVGTGWTTTSAVDFSDGDTIILSNYEDDTFHNIRDSNPLVVSSDGDYAKIDSLADLKELDKASSAVTTSVDDDTLIIDIVQSSGTHHLQLSGLGDDYLTLA